MNLLAYIALMPLSLMWKAYILLQMWALLVLPSFPKLTLSFGEAATVLLLASYVRLHRWPSDKKVKPDVVEAYVFWLLVPLVFWALAFFINKVLM